MSPHIIKAASGVNGHQQTQTDTPRHPWTMSGWKTHNFGTTQEGGNFFHLALLGHQNIKTSLNFLEKEKDYCGRPYFVLFSSVREKLKVTVSLSHLLLKISPGTVSWNAGKVSWRKFSAGFGTSCSAAPSSGPPSPPSSSPWGARGGWGCWGRATWRWSGGWSCAARRGRSTPPPPHHHHHRRELEGSPLPPSWSQAVLQGEIHQEGSSENLDYTI